MRIRGWYVGCCRLDGDLQHVGWQEDWYDGPIYSFGFRWFHVYWLEWR